jgi:mRNA interferase HicA
VREDCGESSTGRLDTSGYVRLYGRTKTAGPMTTIETNRAKIVRRLGMEGWRLLRNGSEHDVYDHASKPGVLTVPQHRSLSPGVARQIAKVAGWR